LTDYGTQFKGAKFVRCCVGFGIQHQSSSIAHPQTNGQVERANGLILQGMSTRMFHDLEAKGRNWHKISIVATRDTSFNLVYEADAVLRPEIYLQSARVAYFNEENQAEARELNSNMLEERCNTALANVQKYQQSMKKYYNKSVVQRQLNIRDLVLKKDIRTKDKHKFSSP
jgi:transposase InsO family protein